MSNGPFFKLNLTVLRFALFRNVEVTQDLQACHHGLKKLCQHFNVRLRCAVDSGANTRFGSAQHEFNMDVRHFLVVSINDPLVAEPDERAVSCSRLKL